MGIKINAGCGRHVLDGWVNIDVQPSRHANRDPDILCDLRTIPLPDGCADEIMSIHVFEHFYLWEAEVLLKEWHRLLVPGGKLALEMPDLIKCCRNIVNGIGMDGGGKNPHAMGLWGLYGDPRDKDPFMGHHWGWAPKTLKTFLQEHGFGRIAEEIPQWHAGGKKNRDMRIVSIKL